MTPKRIDREVPAELDIHLVLDNYATHKHAKVKSAMGVILRQSYRNSSLGVTFSPASSCRYGAWSRPFLEDRRSTLGP